MKAYQRQQTEAGEVFKTRDRATEYIADKGIPVQHRTLGDMASRGIGPRYALINGRAVYRDKDLDAWIEEQFSRPPQRRRA